MKIGITGGIGSGKTEVCNIFKHLNIPIYNTDIEAKRLMASDLQVKSKIINLLGESTYKEGELNRKYIADKIFNNKLLINKLNEIVHPAVINDFNKKASQEKHIVKESALLIESGTYKDLDVLILVYTNEDIRIERVMKRDNISREDVVKKIDNQMSDEEKKKYADYIIYNNKELLLPQTIEILNKLIRI